MTLYLYVRRLSSEERNFIYHCILAEMTSSFIHNIAEDQHEQQPAMQSPPFASSLKPIDRFLTLFNGKKKNEVVYKWLQMHENNSHVAYY